MVALGEEWRGRVSHTDIESLYIFRAPSRWSGWIPFKSCLSRAVLGPRTWGGGAPERGWARIGVGGGPREWRVARALLPLTPAPNQGEKPRGT